MWVVNMESILSEEPQSLSLDETSLDFDFDLDYLETGHLTCPPCSPVPQLLNSPDSEELVKIVVLGAPSVGKTSMIQQFVWENFVDEYAPTNSRHTYYPSVIVNEHMYQLKITDVPALPYFPVNSVYELAECQYGLRDASAYMLVLDLSSLDSFHYLETVRDQIKESRDISTVPFIVVGNKVDLFDNEDEACVQQRRAIMDQVSKWGCEYVECSARYSSLVYQVFRQLMMSVDSCPCPTTSNTCSSLIQDAIASGKCSVL